MAREIAVGGVKYVLAGSSDQGNVYVIQNSESEQSDNSQSSSQEVSQSSSESQGDDTNLLSVFSMFSTMWETWERSKLSCSKIQELVLKRLCPPMTSMSALLTQAR